MLHTSLQKENNPFPYFTDLLVLNEKMKCPNIEKTIETKILPPYLQSKLQKFQKMNFQKVLQMPIFMFLFYGSANTSVTETELIYILYLFDGTPTIKNLNIEDVKTTDAIGFQASTE